MPRAHYTSSIVLWPVWKQYCATHFDTFYRDLLFQECQEAAVLYASWFFREMNIWMRIKNNFNLL